MTGLTEHMGQLRQRFGFLHKNREDVLSPQSGIQFTSAMQNKIVIANERYRGTEEQYDLYTITKNGAIIEKRANVHRMWLKQRYFDPDCQVHFSIATQENEETKDTLEVIYFQTEAMALLDDAYLLRINTSEKEKSVKYNRIGKAKYTGSKKVYELNSGEMEHCKKLMEDIEKDKHNEIDLPTQDLTEDNIAHLDVLRLVDESHI